MLSKATLRQAFRANLDRVSETPSYASAIASSVHALTQRLSEYLQTQTGLWAGFEPLGFEPDIRSAIDSAKHIRWVFPRVESANALSFYQISSRAELVKNSHGIWEPDPTQSRLIQLSELNGLLIPGLAFDHFGNRLGRGRGHYDRTLSEIVKTSQPLKIGIALERQMAEQELPHDPHDIAMDLVLTESRSITRPVAEDLNRPLAGSSKGSLS